MPSFLLSLVSDTVFSVFNKWLTPVEFVTLNSAFSNSNSRVRFLALSSEVLEFDSVCDVGTCWFVRSEWLIWALERNYKMRKMFFERGKIWSHWCGRFSSYTYTFNRTTHLELDCFFVNQDTVNNEAFASLLNLCPQLISVKLYGLIELDFRSIFNTVNPNIIKQLQHLYVSGGNPTKTHILTALEVFSTNLMIVDIDCTSCAVESLKSFLFNNAHSLSNLTLHSKLFTSEVYLSLTKCCHLVHICLDSATQTCTEILTGCFHQIISSCPSIKHFGFSFSHWEHNHSVWCTKVSDDVACPLWELEFTSFHSLELCDCLRVCGTMLAVLTFVHCNEISNEEVARCILQYCLNVKTISLINCGEDSVTTECLTALVMTGNMLRSLSVNPCDNFTQTDIITVCNANVLLTTLTVAYSTMTMLDVMKCFEMCSGLEQIVCHKCYYIDEDAVVSWRRLAGVNTFVFEVIV